MSVNVRLGMAVVVSIGATTPSIASVEDAISLKPAILLQDDSADDLTPVSPIDQRRVHIDLSLHYELNTELPWMERELSREGFSLGAQATDLTLRADALPVGSSLLLDQARTLTDKNLNRIIDGEERSALDFGPRLRVHFDRPTSLRDGGVSGSLSNLDASFTEDRLYGFANEQGRFDLYDISLRWDAFTPGPVTFSLIGGFKAIRADVSEGIDEFDSGGAYVSTRLEDEYRITPIPIVGGGVRWDVGDGFYFEGSAQTHTIPDGNTLLDFTAETGIDFSPTVGFRAGYTYVRTAIEFEQFNARLSQSGVFARFQISF